MIKLLLKLQHWKDHNLERGFYIRSSYCSVGGGDSGTWHPKQRLMFAWGNKEWVLKYL